MNESVRISELVGHFLSAINLYQRKQNWNFFIFVINGNQTFISQIYRVVCPIEEKLDFFNHLGFESKSESVHKISLSSPHSIRAPGRYLNDKNAIHGRETPSTFRFIAETFESDFKSRRSLEQIGTYYSCKHKWFSCCYDVLASIAYIKIT